MMDSALGPVRLISLGIFTFALTVATTCLSCLLLWVTHGRAMSFSWSWFAFRLLIQYFCVLVPALVEWALRLQTFNWGELDWLLSKRWTGMPFWRLTVFIKSWRRASLVLFHLFASSLCGVLYVYTAGFVPGLHSARASSQALVWLMVTYGAMHSLSHTADGADRISYPSIHLSRLRQVMNSLHPAFLDSCFVWTRASILSSLLYILTAIPATSVWYTLNAGISSTVLTFSFSVSSKLVNILLSERLHRRHTMDVDHSSVLELLVARLSMYPDQLNTALSFQELSVRSSFYSFQFWGSMFQDHLGTDLWFPLAKVCFKELEGLASSLDSYLEARHETRSKTQAIQWNSPSLPRLASAGRMETAIPQRVLFEEQLQDRQALCVWSAQLLTDVAILSHDHDVCAVLQMPPSGIPGLADIVQLLLTVYALLDQHLEDLLRQSQHQWHSPLLWFFTHLPGRMRSPDVPHECAWTVHTCLDKCINQLCGKFGPGLRKLRNRTSSASAVKALQIEPYYDTLLGRSDFQ